MEENQKRVFEYAEVKEKIEHESSHLRRKNVYDVLNQAIDIYGFTEGSFKDEKTGQEKPFIDVDYVVYQTAEKNTFRTSSQVLTRQIKDAAKLGLMPLRCRIIKRKEYFSLS